MSLCHHLTSFLPCPLGGGLLGITPFHRSWAIYQPSHHYSDPTELATKSGFITRSELWPCHHGYDQNPVVPPCRVILTTLDSYLQINRDINTTARRWFGRTGNRNSLCSRRNNFAVDRNKQIPRRYHRFALLVPKAAKRGRKMKRTVRQNMSLQLCRKPLDPRPPHRPQIHGLLGHRNFHERLPRIFGRRTAGHHEAHHSGQDDFRQITHFLTPLHSNSASRSSAWCLCLSGVRLRTLVLQKPTRQIV